MSEVVDVRPEGAEPPVDEAPVAAEAAEAAETKKPRAKGQTFVSWHEPGEWKGNRDLHYSQTFIGEEPENGTCIMTVRYDPGCVVGVHSHSCDYVSIVVEGYLEIARKRHDVGSMRYVKAETMYGPLVIGPEGCTVIDVMAAGKDRMSMRTNRPDRDTCGEGEGRGPRGESGAGGGQGREGSRA